MRFEKNAACCVAPDMLGLSGDTEDTSVHFACDNVDHDIITIDGKGTFHGMRMIAAPTPGRNKKTYHYQAKAFRTQRHREHQS